MASKTQTGIMDRRLRSVYDLIDATNFKKAVQECDKLLKKSPDSNSVRAVKALALLRLGKTKEGMEILDHLQSDKITDEQALSAMAHCFKDLQCPERILAIYDDAVKSVRIGPEHEDLIAILFMAAVRTGNFKKQQQAASQLYKLKTKNTYFFWILMSIIMQAIDDPSKANIMFYPLAEKMLTKFQSEQMVTEEVETSLILLLYTLTKNWTKKLDFLTSEVGKKLFSLTWDSEYQILETLRELGLWEKVWSKSRDLLLQDPPIHLDQWSLYVDLIDSAVNHLQSQNESVLVETQQMISSLVEKSKLQSRILRAPFLANIKFALECQRHSKSQYAPSGVPTAILDYFDHFGDRLCVFVDLTDFLNDFVKISNDSEVLAQLRLLLDSLENAALKFDNSKKENFDMAMLNVSQLRLFLHSLHPDFVSLYFKEDSNCNSYLPMAEAVLLNCQFNSEEPQSNGDTNGVVLNSNEVLPNEARNLLTAAQIYYVAQLLWRQFQNSHFKSHQILIELLVLLEIGIDHFQRDFSLRVFALKVYGYVCCSSGAIRLCDSLDIKYFQRESLGYLLHAHFRPCAFYDQGRMWARGLTQYYRTSEKDMGELLIQAYKSGQFRKIYEFDEFKRGLSNGLYGNVAQIDDIYFTLINQCPHNFQSLAEILTRFPLSPTLLDSVDHMCDRRDLSILVTYAKPPVHCAGLDDVITTSFDQTKTVYYWNLIMVLAVHSAVCRVEAKRRRTNNDENGDAENSTLVNASQQERYESFIKTLENVVMTGRKKLCDEVTGDLTAGDDSVKRIEDAVWQKILYPEMLVEGPFPERFEMFWFGEYWLVIRFFMQLFGASCFDEPCPDVDDLRKLMQKMVGNHQLFGEKSHFFPYMQICHLSFCVQSIAISLWFMVACSEMLQLKYSPPVVELPMSDKKSKRKNKQHQQQSVSNVEEGDLESRIEEQPQVVQFRSCVELLSTVNASIEGLISDLGVMLESNIVELSLLEKSLLSYPDSLNPKRYRALVSRNLKDSYKLSLWCLEQSVLKQNTLLSDLSKFPFKVVGESKGKK